MVNWKTYILPKELEGLGIFSMRDRNKALLAKFCWRISTECDALWSQMLPKKYLTEKWISPSGKRLPCSRVWATCKMGGEIFIKGIK